MAFMFHYLCGAREEWCGRGKSFVGRWMRSDSGRDRVRGQEEWDSHCGRAGGVGEQDE